MIIGDLFEIYKGKSYFKDFIEDEESDYDYITTSGKNNGVKCKVKYNPNYRVFMPGTITVAMQGSVLSSFVQEHNFYLQTHVAALIPKQPLTLRQKLFYTLAINCHANEFNYGRKANTLLPTLEIPSIEEIPDWVETIELPPLYEGKSKNQEKVELPDFNQWKNFKLVDLFEIKKASGPKISEAKNSVGTTPYISATAENNGIALYCDAIPTQTGHCITVGHLADCFYQEEAFVGSNVTILDPNFKGINQATGLFLSTLLNANKYKYSYGRVIGIKRLEEETISLPVNKQGEPDWQLMENYINSLPYSATL